jgi:hypothetical protein
VTAGIFTPVAQEDAERWHLYRRSQSFERRSAYMRKRPKSFAAGMCPT